MSTSQSSWNLQAKVDAKSLKFIVPPHVKEIRDKVLRFVEEECYPAEAKIKELGYGGGMGIAGLKIALDDKKNGRKVSEGVANIIIDLQAKAKAQGLWALGHPKTIGGQGMSFRDYIYVNEVQGRSEIAPLALGTHSLQDSLMLFNHASDEIKAKYLDDLVQARIYPSFAMTEPDVASSDPTMLQTYAKVENGEWVINGRKWWTSNAAEAAYTCVMVRTEFEENGKKPDPHRSFSIILVPTNTKGYNIIRSTHVLGTHGGDHSEVVYDNVRVPYKNLIGKRGHGFIISQERLGPGRIFHCMRWLGQMQRAFDIMCERLVERKMKGKALGDMQLMQQHIFDSYCDIVAHRLMTLQAAEKMDSGDYARVELAACKSWGAKALGRVMDRAIQVFGAKGLTDDTPLSEMYRMSRAARFYDGPDETHISNLGRLVLQEYKNGKRWDFSEGAPVPAKKSASKL